MHERPLWVETGPKYFLKNMREGSAYSTMRKKGGRSVLLTFC